MKKCQIGNEWEGRVLDGLVCVFSDVDITVPPNDTTVREGQNASLSCEFSSNLENVTVVWWRGNQKVPLTDGRFKVERHGSKSVLTIIDVQASDAGEYRCNASSPDKGLSEESTPGQVSLQCKCTAVKVLVDEEVSTEVHCFVGRCRHGGLCEQQDCSGGQQCDSTL